MIQTSPLPEIAPEHLMEVGTIVSPQGLQGALRVYPSSDFPERFLNPGLRWLQLPNASAPQMVELVAGRALPGKNLYVIELAGIGDRTQAENLRGAKLLVSQEDRPPLGEEEYHVADLLNLQVINQLTGETIGQITDVFSAGHDLLEVTLKTPPPENSPEIELSPPKRNKQRRKQSKPPTVLIPFVKEIVPVIDLKAGCVEIHPPPGLLEVNQA
ncbi:ribosome maturation factor RimM [Spirulina subsalsa]|uniref:ribosome maturation factor RimM n=1 Tax=Spirulina subsalsa TaxID=54311 RepID=UPI0002F5ED46|nr:ribosome maturation factor RimM [Spirulina subsalsa]